MASGSTPKISVLMPVYNVAAYLPRALDSVLEQTLREIELICVDDGSTDGSADILRRYAEQDARIRLVFHPGNCGLVAARRSAAALAEGKYIMLLDSDDELLPTACETVWREEQRHPVDILQFGTEVLFSSFLPETEKAAVLEAMRPSRACSGDLLTPCFGERRWSHTLWNKAYRAGLWKEILPFITDRYINISEDEYLFFLLSYFSHSYRGIQTPLYRYALGRGLTGLSSLTAAQYQQYCKRFLAYQSIKEFLNTQQAPCEYHHLLAKMRDTSKAELTTYWMEKVSLSDCPAAYAILVETAGLIPTLSCLAEQYWDHIDDIVDKLVPSSYQVQEAPGNTVRTIGVYYYRMANGGVERVISYLIPLWQSMGYRVILITEQPPSKADFPLPADLVRVLLPAVSVSSRQNYKHRAETWQQIVQSYHIDTIVYAAHVCSLLPWDLLLLKGLGLNCILHSHSTFSHIYYEALPERFALTHSYRLADRVVTLSRVCREYWGHFCPSFYIPNPTGALCPTGEISSCDGAGILWVGRLSPEKRPLDALRAFSLVRQHCPNATLTMVGCGETEDAMAEAKALAQELNLGDSVHFEGFQKDVASYYCKADVFLLTSQYEGFPMVLAESKSHGLPIVMYDLRYLEMVQDSRGVITVPLGDTTRLATELVCLLQDAKHRKAMGAEARQSAEDFAAYSQRNAWQTVFDSLTAPQGAAYIASDRQRLMLNSLLDSDRAAKRSAILTPFSDATAHRLIYSKFMKMAVWYWRITDPLKAWVKRIKKNLH